MISFKILARVGEVIDASRVTIIGIDDDTPQEDRGQVILEVTGSDMPRVTGVFHVHTKPSTHVWAGRMRSKFKTY